MQMIGTLILATMAAAVEPAPALSPAQAQIRVAEARLAAGAPRAADYEALAVGLTRRARETGDSSYYDKALEALARGAGAATEEPEPLLTLAWVRVGRHEFSRARRLAARWTARHPEDPWGYGVLGDALMELGRYDEAERAYQTMLDLKPGPASYSRGAYLREARGDVEGALALMRAALAATHARETEDRAWLLVQVAHLEELAGDPAAAERSCRLALASFPGYHDALTALAGLRLEAGAAEEAETLARAALATAPHAERRLLLADALRAQGRLEEARAAEGAFEAEALQHVARPDNENHELVLYYLERRPDPQRALRIARTEARARRDVQTLDRLAWALHHAGARREARRVMRGALGGGTVDPIVRRHASLILGPDEID